MKIVEIEFDGGCSGNVGTFGYVVRVNNDKEYEGHGKVEAVGMTNNVAEYLAVLKAIQRFKKEVKNPLNYELMIYGDSRLVIEHISKRWGWSKAKIVWNPHKGMPHLKSMLFKVLKELEGINYQSVWVRRNKNSRADALGRK